MQPLQYRQIFSFFWPLVLTSQMMTLAHPIVNAALGRSEGAIVQLAGYGVGFGLGVFLNSPLFPFQQSVAALGAGPRSRRDLTRRVMVLAAAICAGELVLALSPWGDALIGRLMGSTPAVTDLARKILLVQAPIPLLLPLRSLAWGVIMRHRDTRVISRATVLRLALLTVVVFAFAGRGFLAPAVVAGAAMTLAILAETMYSGLLAIRLARAGAEGIDGPGDGPVGWGTFFGFMGPLMVGTVTWSVMRPLINAVIGRTGDPDLAQGGFGFVFPLLILMASPLWSLNNTALVLIRDRHDLRRVARFSAGAILLFVALTGAWAWTPLRSWALAHVFSLEADKALYVTGALLLIPLQSIPLGLRSLCHGFLMNRRRTGVIATASLIKTALIIAVGFGVVAVDPGVNGALLGTVLVVAGGFLETFMVGWSALRLHRALIAASDREAAPPALVPDPLE